MADNKLELTFNRDFTLGDEVDILLNINGIPVLYEFDWVVTPTSGFEVEVATPTATVGEATAINFLTSWQNSVTGYTVSQASNVVTVIGSDNVEFSKLVALDSGGNSYLIPTDYDYTFSTVSSGNKITYSDKIGLIPKGNHVNQWWDDDANEVKTKHNLNDDRITANENDITGKANLSGGNNFTGDQDIEGKIESYQSVMFTSSEYTPEDNVDRGVNIGYDNFAEKGWVQCVRNNSSEIRTLEIQPLGGNVEMGGNLTLIGQYNGNGSGLTNVDAITLDGLDSTDFVRSTGSVTQTITGLKTFENELKLEKSAASSGQQILLDFENTNTTSANTVLSRIYTIHVSDDNSQMNLQVERSNTLTSAISLTPTSNQYNAANHNFVGDIVMDNSSLRIGAFTVAGLPAGSSGMIAYVTDGASVSYRATATGGGSANVLVFYDGTNWIYH